MTSKTIDTNDVTQIDQIDQIDQIIHNIGSLVQPDTDSDDSYDIIESEKEIDNRSPITIRIVPSINIDTEAPVLVSPSVVPVEPTKKKFNTVKRKQKKLKSKPKPKPITITRCPDSDSDIDSDLDDQDNGYIPENIYRYSQRNSDVAEEYEDTSCNTSSCITILSVLGTALAFFGFVCYTFF